MPPHVLRLRFFGEVLLAAMSTLTDDSGIEDQQMQLDGTDLDYGCDGPTDMVK